MAKQTNENSTQPQPTVVAQSSPKSDEELYREIQKLRPVGRYKSAMEEHKKALANPEGGFKTRTITLQSTGKKVDYNEIEKYAAFCIKKFKLNYMFNLTEEQAAFIQRKPLNYFAQKKWADIIG